MKRGKASVVWELVDVDGAQRLMVDVDAPLRPFGADPTPPHGIRLPNAFDDPTQEGDDLGLDRALADEPAPPARATTEAMLKALRSKPRRQ